MSIGRGVRGCCLLLGSLYAVIRVGALEAALPGPSGFILGTTADCWITPKGMERRLPAKAGEYVLPGDRLDVGFGQSIRLSFDTLKNQVIQINGEAVAFLEDNSNLGIELQKGTLYGLIDHGVLSRRVEISTPQAVTSTRDAYFSVKVTAESTESTNYRGDLRLFAAPAESGEINLSSTALRPAQAGVMKKDGIMTRVRQQIGREAFEAINRISRQFPGKKNISYDQTLREREREDLEVFGELMPGRLMKYFVKPQAEVRSEDKEISSATQESRGISQKASDLSRTVRAASSAPDASEPDDAGPIVVF